MSKCNHEHVCVQCVNAEIAKLEERIKILKNKLPSTQIIYIPTIPNTIICPHHINPWNFQTTGAGIGGSFKVSPSAPCFQAGTVSSVNTAYNLIPGSRREI